MDFYESDLNKKQHLGGGNPQLAQKCSKSLSKHSPKPRSFSKSWKDEFFNTFLIRI